MAISWGYSPKVEKFIPLGDFPIDRYLIIARQAIENLGWNLSHISERGIIAYSPISLQSYSEEISIRIESNFAIVKSECVGIQMWFNDYGKNALNLEKFFHEFEYVEFHLKDSWEESLAKFHDFVATQDQDYFEKAPLTAKNKIKNIFYLFYPRQKYLVTPILILINSLYYIAYTIFTGLLIKYLIATKHSFLGIENMGYYVGANNRELVLNGQYWRLITYQFVHGSIFHLFFNMYALAYIGLMVEHKLGAKRYLGIYLISGICGGLVSLIYHQTGYMLGASGAIMGLFGAFLALLLSKAFERNATKALLISTVFVVAIMLLNGLKQRVDNAAHLGGLISGFIACYILYNKKLFSAKIRVLIVAILTMGFTIAVLTGTVNYQSKEFAALEQKYKRNLLFNTMVYQIPASMPKDKKLKIIKTSAIDVWKKNDLLIKQMLNLNLNKQQRFKAECHAKIVALNLKISILYYKECAEETLAYRVEIRSLINEINKVRVEAGESELAK
ncbi:MAG: rhomboid family intramembrane serine protease [Bacteroidota bacterium]